MPPATTLSPARWVPAAWRPWLSALLATLAVGLLLAMVDRTERAHLEHDQRAMVLERLSLVRVRLESHLNEVIASARSLALVYATRPDFSEDEFVAMARVASEGRTSLVNIGLIRGTVLRHVHPLPGSEKAIGLDIRKTPSMWPAFQRMMATRATIIAGPVALVQGGTGIIVRIPVHRLGPPDTPGLGDFLGAISIPLDAEKVFAESGLPELEEEFVVALRGRDGQGARGDVFMGLPSTFDQALAQQEIVLPGGAWQIAAYPRDEGLPASVQRLRLVGVLMCAMAGLLAFNLTRQAQRRAESDARLNAANLRLQTVLQTIPDLMFEMDSDGRYLDIWPGRDADLLAFRREDLIGRTVDQMLPPEAVTQVMLTLAEAKASGSARGRRITLTLPHGESHFELSAAVNDDPVAPRFVLMSRDVTHRQQVEQEIERLAFHDPLTGLPNRRLLTDRLHHALSACARNHRRAALLFIDLDNFKSLNDTQGHDVGDLLLVEVARRLTGIVREIDTVARLGGDEFVVLIEDLEPSGDNAAAAARGVGEKIGAAVAQPHALRDVVHVATCSVGIRVFEHGARVEDLLKHADTAMYAAKTAGRNTVRFFDPAMEAALQHRSQTESGLRLALQRHEFDLHAQIQVDTQDRPIGAEVLLRWHHPERGLVGPAEFIGLAEDVGLIVPIGRWVLERAAAQLRSWQGRPVLGRLSLAVNVSPRQLHEPGFVEMVRQIVADHGIDPALLKLEITESAVLDDVDQVVALMQSLGLSGVRFSMDDFGTGYSSLQYLKRLPLSQLKIDRSFVRDLASDHNDQAIVRTIIAMAHTMNLDVIAEGVETTLQRSLLTAAGCSRFQGYLIGRPVPMPEFEALVDRLGQTATPMA
ncbi:EAL domain-containing protein [Sphaerotilus mobilis]|uniref:bifunctional diguanylate cyclase/phosphodiesterase n=1 Tax=Sphaerotilus mobilis TaxID=47994 RepID=UPI00102BF904|nr:EAL domain-containing protein [Sphaerotilus mobilis]